MRLLTDDRDAERRALRHNAAQLGWWLAWTVVGSAWVVVGWNLIRWAWR